MSSRNARNEGANKRFHGASAYAVTGAERLPFEPQHLEAEAAVLYGVGRLSHNYAIHAGVFRRLLSEIAMTPTERPVYQPWLEANVFDTMERSRSQQPLATHEVQALRVANDPAVMVADTLQDAYQMLRPDAKNDVRLWEKAHYGIDLVLSSIHRPHPDHLRAVIELHNTTPPTIDPAA